MNQTHTFFRDERGTSPYVLIASVVVFVIVSVGLVAGLVSSMQASAIIQVSSQLEESVSSAVRDPIRQGYDAVAALPTEERVEIAVGAFTATALRTVEINDTTQTARVTVAVGAFNGHDFGPAAGCEPSSDRCVVLSELVSGAGEVTP